MREQQRKIRNQKSESKGQRSKVRDRVSVDGPLPVLDDRESVEMAAFDIAFGDPGLRRAIFLKMAKADEAAAEQGEVPGLRVRYAVELSLEGYAVRRRAEPWPDGVS